MEPYIYQNKKENRTLMGIQAFSKWNKSVKKAILAEIYDFLTLNYRKRSPNKKIFNEYQRRKRIINHLIKGKYVNLESKSSLCIELWEENAIKVLELLNQSVNLGPKIINIQVHYHKSNKGEKIINAIHKLLRDYESSIEEIFIFLESDLSFLRVLKG